MSCCAVFSAIREKPGSANDSPPGSGVDVRKFLVRPWPGGRHPRGAVPGIGAAHMTEYVSTRHQRMIILAILSNQPNGGTQQSAATGEGVAVD